MEKHSFDSLDTTDKNTFDLRMISILTEQHEFMLNMDYDIWNSFIDLLESNDDWILLQYVSRIKNGKPVRAAMWFNLRNIIAVKKHGDFNGND